MEYMEQQMQQQIEAGLSNAEQCYARISELEEQNAALAAAIEALREAYGSFVETGFDEIPGDAFSAAPQHHLRQMRADAVMDAINNGFTPEQFHALKDSRDGVQLRADAGRVGFIAGYMLCNDGAALLKHNYKGMADNYHASILAGKE